MRDETFAARYALARAGDRAARWLLLADFHSGLAVQARRMMGAAARRLESPTAMAGGVLLSAFGARLPTLSVNASRRFAGWLRSMLRLRILALVRKGRRTEESIAVGHLVDRAPDELTRLVGTEDAGLVSAAIRGLTAPQQTAVLLRYWDELSLAEIGDRMGLTPHAAHALLSRARQRLRLRIRNQAE